MYTPAKTPTIVLCVLLALALSTAVTAQAPPCRPCAGLRLAADNSIQLVADALRATPTLEPDARLYVAWSEVLDGSANLDRAQAQAQAIRDAGGTPWIVLDFQVAAPVTANVEALEVELAAVASLARRAGANAHVQLAWRQADAATPAELAFLIKRAAVAVTGAQPDARVIVGPLPANAGRLRALYANDVAAYVDGVALRPADELYFQAAIDALGEVDPGKPIVVDALTWPSSASGTLVEAAALAAQGVAVTFFDAPSDTDLQAAANTLTPLKLLANEFQGDLSLDPTSTPEGASRAWAFVRGEDLGLRVIVEAAANSDLVFPDTQLRRPSVVEVDTGERHPAWGQSLTDAGLVVPIERGPITLLRLERASAAELEGVADEVVVADARTMPVEEILRRLQAFEDDQARRLTRYQGRNTMHLRFQLGNGIQTLEASYAGRLFFERGTGFDWAWEDFYFSGVKWRGKRIPELPLIQPEKAGALPLEILFTKAYRYRLRGVETVEGRECWAVEFEPASAVEPGQSLYQGTVWIDRELYTRVKTRALQVGLTGDVISNEETAYFTPVGLDGQPTTWAEATQGFVLPTRTVGNQLLSVLNSATQLEMETVLTDIQINPDNFEEMLEAVRASDATMVRDTDAGLRYLIKGEDGERMVQEQLDNDRLFLAGGVFFDESVDFPVPLAGINYLSLDFRGTGNQVNLLFAGPLLTANLAEPRLFGSKWDAGINVFGFFLPTGDERFRDGVEILGEEVESTNLRTAFFLGRPLGAYTKIDFTYAAGWRDFGRADDTDDAFILPQDTLTHTLATSLTYTRNGYRLSLGGDVNLRDDWAFWGLPGNTEFDSDQEEFSRWQISVAKTWWLPKFRKIGIELEHLGGENLDRFSKYDFGLFGDADVAGYPNGLIKAEEVNGLHLNYGINIGNAVRVEIEGDAVWATDELFDLDNELLAGIGFEGTVPGPWGTLLNFEVGVAVAGPSDDVAGRIVFLKPLGNRKGKKKR